MNHRDKGGRHDSVCGSLRLLDARATRSDALQMERRPGDYSHDEYGAPLWILMSVRVIPSSVMRSNSFLRTTACKYSSRFLFPHFFPCDNEMNC